MSSRLMIFLLAGLLSIGSAFARVNINTASVEELQTLDGIGPVRAQAIVDYRTQNGPIRKLNELGSLEHFPDSLLKSLRNKVTFGSLEKESKAKPPIAQPAGRETNENAKAMPSIRPAAPARPATPAKPASVSSEVVVERHEAALPPAPARPAMPARPPVAKPAASDAQVTLQKPAPPAKPAMPVAAKPAAPAAPAKPAVPAAPAAVRDHEAAAHDDKPAPTPARPAMPAPARPAAVH